MAVASEQVLWMVPPTLLYNYIPDSSRGRKSTENDPSWCCCWGIVWAYFEHRPRRSWNSHGLPILNYLVLYDIGISGLMLIGPVQSYPTIHTLYSLESQRNLSKPSELPQWNINQDIIAYRLLLLNPLQSWTQTINHWQVSKHLLHS